MSSMVAAAAMRSSAASRAARMSSITGLSFRECMRTSTAESPDEARSAAWECWSSPNPGFTRGGEIACWRPRHGADAISTGVRRRRPVVRRRSSDSRRTTVARGRTSGRTPLRSDSGIDTIASAPPAVEVPGEPAGRQIRRRQHRRAARRSARSRRAASSAALSISMAPWRSRSPKCCCRSRYSACSSSAMPATAATTSQPAASRGSGPEISSRRW